MREGRIPMVNGDEQGALCQSHTYHHWNSGERKRIKAGYRKRVRRSWRNRLHEIYAAKENHDKG